MKRELLNVNEIEFRSLHNEKLSDSQIASKLGFNRRFITTYRNKLNLKPNNPYLLNIDEDMFMDMYNSGLSFSEMARRFDCSHEGITRIANKRNILSHDSIKVAANIEKYQKLYDNGLNDEEIAKLVGVTNGAIQSFRKSRGLNPNFSYEDFKTIDIDKVRELSDKGISDRKAAEMIGCSPDGIWAVRKREGIIRANLAHNELIELSHYQKQVLIGTVLGDSSLKNNGTNSSLSCAHSLKQVDLCIRLMEIFSDYGSTNRYFESFSEKRNITYYGNTFSTLSNPAFTYYRDLFYPNGKKIIPKEIYDDFTDVSLAWLFMDDGYKASRGHGIATNCFSLEDISILQNILLEKFELKTTVHNGNRLYISAKCNDKFMETVSPHILECTKYKLQQSLNSVNCWEAQLS